MLTLLNSIYNHRASIQGNALSLVFSPRYSSVCMEFWFRIAVFCNKKMKIETPPANHCSIAKNCNIISKPSLPQRKFPTKLETSKKRPMD